MIQVKMLVALDSEVKKQPCSFYQ